MLVRNDVDGDGNGVTNVQASTPMPAKIGPESGVHPALKSFRYSLKALAVSRSFFICLLNKAHCSSATSGAKKLM